MRLLSSAEMKLPYRATIFMTQLFLEYFFYSHIFIRLINLSNDSLKLKSVKLIEY